MVPKLFQFPKSARRTQKMILQGVRQSTELSNLDWNARKDFFAYTRGRFARNESYELSQRYVRFNMKELTRIAAEAVGSGVCVNVEKFLMECLTRHSF